MSKTFCFLKRCKYTNKIRKVSNLDIRMVKNPYSCLFFCCFFGLLSAMKAWISSIIPLFYVLLFIEPVLIKEI